MPDPVIPETPLVAAAPTPPPEPLPDVKALEAEIERLKAESAEKDNGMRYWHEEAKKASAAKAAPAPAKADDEPPADDGLLDIVSRGDSKALAAAIRKQGFVSADEVQAQIESRAKILAIESQLAADYPDLKDMKSDFFKETAQHYGALLKEGVPQHIAMQQAAKLTALDGYTSGKRRAPAEEEERAARARAQAGEKGRKTQEPEPGDDKLDDDQKRICEQMGVTEEAYIKRAKAGVVYGRRV